MWFWHFSWQHVQFQGHIRSNEFWSADFQPKVTDYITEFWSTNKYKTFHKSSSASMRNEKKLKQNSKDKDGIKWENNWNESISSKRLWNEHRVPFTGHLLMEKVNAENHRPVVLESLEVFLTKVNQSDLPRKDKNLTMLGYQRYSRGILAKKANRIG